MKQWKAFLTLSCVFVMIGVFSGVDYSIAAQERPRIPPPFANNGIRPDVLNLAANAMEALG